MWSQMHGNESTTTKAVLDLINFLATPGALATAILESCTIMILPMLNPDGAAAYTRVNANQIDLNRDAQERSQPESRLLRAVYEEFGPDYCFNLHDQRTIFNVGSSPAPATISFLAPAHDAERSISESRASSMQLIVAMDRMLQSLIPGRIGRYDDGFNSNCVGDAFQMLGTPMILFEAGHYPLDYERERTREFIYYAILNAVETIAHDRVTDYPMEAYLDIPENNKLFFDILLRNAHVLDPGYGHGTDIGILYKEVLEAGKIEFRPFVDKTGDLSHFYGHTTYNCLENKDLKAIRSHPFLSVLRAV
jgi:hypothetical protein